MCRGDIWVDTCQSHLGQGDDDWEDVRGHSQSEGLPDSRYSVQKQNADLKLMINEKSAQPVLTREKWNYGKFYRNVKILKSTAMKNIYSLIDNE